MGVSLICRNRFRFSSLITTSSSCLSFSEEVGEVFVIEFGESMTIIDSLTDDEHGREGKVVVMDDLRKVF